MPTIYLSPDALATDNYHHWDADAGTSASDKINAVEVDDGHYIFEGDDNDNIEFSFPSPSVSSGDMASITSIQLETNGRYPARGSGGSNVKYRFQNFPSDVAFQTLNYPNSASNQVVNGSVVSTDSAGNAIDYSELESLTLYWQKYGASDAVRVNLIRVAIIYVASATADNAIFFGHNF